MIFGIYMSNTELAGEHMAKPYEAFLSYFKNAAAWSFIGVVASCMMNRCAAAFEPEKEIDEEAILNEENGEEKALVSAE